MSRRTESGRSAYERRGAYRVLRVGHGVERAEAHGELVNDEVVSVVLGLDNSAKTLLIFGAR